MRSHFDVDGYEIEGLLGAGPTGETWLARESASGAEVALHRVQPRDADALDHARRLVERLNALNHPRVRRIRELLPFDDELVFVLDHIEGGSLEQLLLVRGTLDPGELVTMAATVSSALTAAHERGLVHGDLRPEDILFTTDGTPLVTDIGFGRIAAPPVDELARPYADPAEPEDADPTPAGDVYSLAAICYAALTGLVPRPGEPQRPVHQVAPGVPPGIAHAIQAGLQPAWDMRPHMGQFGALLDAAARRAPVRLPDSMSRAEPAAPDFGLPTPDFEGPPADAGPVDAPTQTLASFESSGGYRPPTGPTARAGGSPPPAVPIEQGHRTDRAAPPFAPPPKSAGERPPEASRSTTGQQPPFAGQHPFSGQLPFTGQPPSSGQQQYAGQQQHFSGQPPFSAQHGTGGTAAQVRPPAPLVRDGADDDGPDQESSHTRQLVVIGAVLIAVIGVITTVVLWRMSTDTTPIAEQTHTAKPKPKTPTPTPPTDPFSLQWFKNFELFDDRRANAYANRDPELLNQLYAPDSQAYKENRKLMADLAQNDAAKVLDLNRSMITLTTESRQPRAIVFEVVRMQQAYTVVMNNGQRHKCPAGPLKKVRIEIVPLQGSTAWRISREWQVGGPDTPDLEICDGSKPAG
ncbi:protein kinase [Actinopolymorpha sp. B11F2]|uniref:serine/threonine protein kinase n=1 Tax=Actinopolymorpha sp. B11F2 TaxID=3160862 RepID=UPI0032E4F0F9